MADFSFKNNKQIEIIKEMQKTASDKYEINGIDLSKAKFMWRKFQEAFQILAPGSYSIVLEAGNTFLKIDDTVLLGEAIEFQVIYVFDQESSQYIDDFPDIAILRDKYNQLQRDFTNLNNLLKSNNISGDTLKMFYVLPELNEGEVWIRTADGWKGTNVADLEKIVQELITLLETEIKPAVEKFIRDELAKAQAAIDAMLVHDYFDIPYLNKMIVQIYIDTETKEIRECDNTKFEPLSAVGLKFIKEDGSIVTRCYFRGVYDKPSTVALADGVWWQNHTEYDALTLTQPEKWKSQAFELCNGKIYFDRGNPILLDGKLGEIVFHEYETLNQAKADSSLKDGDYVIVTGGVQSNDGGQGVYQKKGADFELRDFNRSFLGQKLDKQNTIEELKKTTQYAVGDVVEVLGYYAEGDGAGHPRQKKPQGYTGEDAVIGADGSIWGIVHNGEINVSWLGAKGDGASDDTTAVQKSLNFTNDCKVVFKKGTFVIKDTLNVGYNGISGEYSTTLLDFSQCTSDVCIKYGDGVSYNYRGIMKNLLIKCNSNVSTQWGLKISRIDAGNKFENIRIYDAPNGIDIVDNFYLNFDNVRLDGISGKGIGIRGTTPTNNSIFKKVSINRFDKPLVFNATSPNYTLQGTGVMFLNSSFERNNGTLLTVKKISNFVFDTCYLEDPFYFKSTQDAGVVLVVSDSSSVYFRNSLFEGYNNKITDNDVCFTGNGTVTIEDTRIAFQNKSKFKNLSDNLKVVVLGRRSLELSSFLSTSNGTDPIYENNKDVGLKFETEQYITQTANFVCKPHFQTASNNLSKNILKLSIPKLDRHVVIVLDLSVTCKNQGNSVRNIKFKITRGINPYGLYDTKDIKASVFDTEVQVYGGDMANYLYKEFFGDINNFFDMETVETGNSYETTLKLPTRSFGVNTSQVFTNVSGCLEVSYFTQTGDFINRTANISVEVI